MKGATAEPLLKTITPPKIAIMMNTGSSQNFFRTLRNAQNSRRKLIIDASELVLECFRRRARRRAEDPIAPRCRLEFASHRVLASQPHQEANGNDAEVEQDAK
jgi:hypothetical protein